MIHDNLTESIEILPGIPHGLESLLENFPDS